MQIKSSAQHQTQVAFGSDVTLVIVSNHYDRVIQEYFANLWQRVFEFERQFSRFLPNSELSQFNRNAGNRQAISAEFQQLLGCASKLSLQTAGLFNPFVLPLLQKAGYAKSFTGEYGAEAEINFSDRSCTSPEKMLIGHNWASIPYGTALDLGGCGKGYIGDVLVTDMPNWVRGFWFSFGGDVIGGGQDEAGQAWTVEITDTLETNQPAIGQYFCLNDSFCIATSSCKERRGIENGKAWHHIIDPRTRQPAESDIVSATVVADSLVLADVLATCSIIIGSEQSIPFFDRHTVKAALLGVLSKQGLLSYDKYGSAIRIYNQQESRKL